MITALFDLQNYSYAFTAWPPFIVGACLVVLGLLILYKERASTVSLAFFCMVLTGAFWLIFNGVVYSTLDYRLAFFWARIEHIGIVFIPITFFYFTLIVLRRLDPLRAWARTGLILSGGFAITLFTTDRFVVELKPYPWGRYPQLGWIAAIFLVFFFALSLTSLIFYWKAYHRLTPGPQRFRLKTFFLAFCVGLLGAIDYLPCYGIAVYPVGYLPVYACILLLAQIIWLYGFPDITPAFAAPQIIANMPSGLFVFDHDGFICVVNETACQLVSKSERELIGSPFRNLINEFVDPDHKDILLREGSLRDGKARVRGASGTSRVCQFSFSVIQDTPQRTLAHVCLVQDITEQTHAQEALQASEARFRRLIESNIIGFIIVDGQGRITEANDAFLKMLGYSREDLTAGQVGGSAMTPPEYNSVDEWMKEKLHATGSCIPVEKEYIRKDGSRIPVLVGVVQLSPGEETAVCFVIDATDRRLAMQALQKASEELEHRVVTRTAELTREIALREEAEEALRRQTLTDALTGLYNRRGFIALATRHLQLARRSGKGFWLFMADLDNLKPINDTYGHAEGDHVLVEAGNLLKQTFRQSDITARIGGDEFAVAVIDDPGNNDKVLFARLLEILNTYNQGSGRPYKIGLSIGSTHVDPNDNQTLKQMMARADAALYEKKKQKTDSMN